MNNDSTSTDLPSSEPAAAPALDANDSQSTAATAGDDALDAALRRQDAQSPAQKKAHAQTKKKFEFINHLTLHLDVLIYAELSILYYMEYGPIYLFHKKDIY